MALSQSLQLITAEARQTPEQRAKALIGTKHAPAGFEQMRNASIQALAYHSLDPYPFFAFQDWKKEERGPMPRCMPFVRGIVRKGAKWLFGRPVNINLPGNLELQKFLMRTWADNKMPARMVSAAETGGVQGAIVLKWSYNEDDPLCKCRYQILSPIDNCRLFFDPHDSNRLLMLRIQYPYQDSATGKWFFYREEWTDQEEIHYLPVPAVTHPIRVGAYDYGSIFVTADGNKEPDNYEKWQIDQSQSGTNDFGIIPAWIIYNIETNSSWGCGDLWGLFRVVDRVNLSYHLQDRSNQFDSEPTPVYIDLVAEADSYDRPIAPGQAQSLKTDGSAEGADMRQGKVQLLEPSGKIRPYMESYARDLRQMIYDAVGYVEIHQGEVTNKGNLTQAVLSQLYAPLIEATDEKRKTYGDDGIAVFLKRLIQGMKQAGVKEFQSADLDDPDSFAPQLVWSDYFPLTEAEKLVRVERLTSEEASGYVDHETAVRKVAVTEEVDDVEAMVSKMKNWKPPVEPTDGVPRLPQAKNLQTKEDGSDA